MAKVKLLKQHLLGSAGDAIVLPDGTAIYLARVGVAELVAEKEEKKPRKTKEDKTEIKTKSEKWPSL